MPVNSRTPALRVRLVNESSWPRLPRGWIDRICAEAYARHAARREEPAAVNVLVVDDAGIAPLNRRFKGHEGPTDVLAFPDGDEDPRTGALQLGDIVVSAETAEREAACRAGARPDWTARHELALYALHGVLHLLGFDDGDESEAKTMRAEQAALFAAAEWPEPPG